MITKRTWQEFKDTGMLWWTNRFLQLFGWAIVVQVDDETNKVIEEKTYAARSKFRGMSPDMDAEGFEKVTAYLQENIDELSKYLDE